MGILLQAQAIAQATDEKGVCISRRQCKAKDTVRHGHKQAQRSTGEVTKINLIVNETVVSFQRLN